MDIILKAIKCHQCQDILTAPILLPCGHSICKQHADEADDSVNCPKCSTSHQNQQFAINTELLEMINSQIGAMDFGPCHKQAKEACDKLEDIFGQIDRIIKDPIYYSHEVVDQMKNKVLLKREQLKLEIDENTEKLLAVLNEYQKSCEINFDKSIFESSLEKLKQSREEKEKLLNEWSEFLNRLKFDDERWKGIKNECECKINDIRKELESVQKLILMDEYGEKRAQVDLFVDIDLSQHFQWEHSKNSEILDRKQKTQLRALCEISPLTKWTLLWRGSRDGFEAFDFHSKCDNRPNTLTIIETTKGYIFGGYTDLTWNCVSNGYGHDPNAYIFSLVNDVATQFVMKVKLPGYAIRSHPSYGPTFGNGYDIHICNNSNQSIESCSQIQSYLLPENLKMYPYILAGTKYFQVKKIEVFQLE